MCQRHDLQTPHAMEKSVRIGGNAPNSNQKNMSTQTCRVVKPNFYCILGVKPILDDRWIDVWTKRQKHNAVGMATQH